MYQKSSKCMRRKEYRSNDQLRSYCNESKPRIVTTRFNKETWIENEKYREKHHPSLGCAYGVPSKTTNSFTGDDVLLVLEMNNSENRIMGIGMVKNQPLMRSKQYSVYENPEYNRYVYLGKTRIDRSVMNEEEEEMMKVFDILCFTGKRHQKRLSGIKAFPMDMLFKMSLKLKELEKPDLVDFMIQMFKTRMK